MTPAVFLDRDGTLLEEACYPDRLDRLIFFPFSIDAVRLLNRGGFAAIVATNQSGVGRGMFDEEFVVRAHELMASRIVEGGGRIHGCYFCPHHPGADVDKYRCECDCRKPQPGMLRRAAADLDLDLSRSYAIGDKWSDIEAGQAAGAKGILVRTGYGRSSERAPRSGVDAVAVVDDLISAAAWILRHA